MIETFYKELYPDSFSPKDILAVASKLQIPLRSIEKDIQPFLQYVETAVYKLRYKKYCGAKITSYGYYTVDKIKMTYILLFLDDTLLLLRRKRSPVDNGIKPGLQGLVCVSEGKQPNLPLSKNISLPTKVLPLLVNSPYPTVQLFAKDRLRGAV